MKTANAVARAHQRWLADNGFSSEEEYRSSLRAAKAQPVKKAVSTEEVDWWPTSRSLAQGHTWRCGGVARVW